MAKAWYDYTLEVTGTKQCQLYGIITSIPSALKTSNVRIGGWIRANTGGGMSTTTAECDLRFKLNNGTEEQLAYGYNYHAGQGADTGQKSFEKYLDLRNATKLAFNMNGSFSSNVLASVLGTFHAYIWIEMQSEFTTETIITASKLNNLSGFVGAGSAVTSGGKITRTSYAAIASAVGASAPDSTYPKSADLSAILAKVNGKGIAKSWDSTSGSDY